MNVAALQSVIETILIHADELKNTHIREPITRIDYVGIFPSGISEHSGYIELMQQLHANNVYADDDGELYCLPQGIHTTLGNVFLVKICHVPSRYNPKGNKIGYVDYQVEHYVDLKKKYGHIHPFTCMHGDGWEILCLENETHDVSVYLPNIPLSNDIDIRLHS